MLSSKTVVFNLVGREPFKFWRGRKWIFYIHSCIRYALFEFFRLGHLVFEF